MMITLQDAINHLYELAVQKGKTQSPGRLKVLGDYCIQELELRGVRGALAEQDIPGGGRPKTWDIAWHHQGKHRLAISLKSILKNLAGTVPNRIDDLMGEAANAQLYSPEIVIGYVMILDVSSDAYSPKHGSTWSDLLRCRLSRLSGRCPPAWTIGTVEAFAYAEVDFSESPVLRPSTTSFESFFDVLADQVRLRNPIAFPDEPAVS